MALAMSGPARVGAQPLRRGRGLSSCARDDSRARNGTTGPQRPQGSSSPAAGSKLSAMSTFRNSFEGAKEKEIKAGTERGRKGGKERKEEREKEKETESKERKQNQSPTTSPWLHAAYSGIPTLSPSPTGFGNLHRVERALCSLAAQVAPAQPGDLALPPTPTTGASCPDMPGRKRPGPRTPAVSPSLPALSRRQARSSPTRDRGGDSPTAGPRRQ